MIFYNVKTFSIFYLLALFRIFFPECNRENEASLAVLPDLLTELDSMSEVHLKLILPLLKFNDVEI